MDWMALDDFGLHWPVSIISTYVFEYTFLGVWASPTAQVSGVGTPH